MNIQYDFRENGNHPTIIEALKDNGKNTVEQKPLLVGDYFSYPVLIEGKVTVADFVGSVQDGRLFQQAQDLLYNQKQDPNIKPYILVAGNIDDIFNLKKRVIDQDGIKNWIPVKINPTSLIAAWASVASQGIPIIFLANEYFLVKGMLNLFEKHSDGKDRTYIPVRKPSTSSDNIVTNYLSLPEIGETIAKRLALKFPIPKKLYNAAIDELIQVEGIGKPTAIKLVKYFNGEV